MTQDFEYEFDDQSDDLFEQAFELSPLNAIDAESVDRLTQKMQHFFIEFINSGSIVTAKKRAKVTPKLWLDWNETEQFVKVFEIIKSPPMFARQLSAAIVYRAMTKHYQMLNHEKITVQQWGIDRAYQLAQVFKDGSDKDKDRRDYNAEDVKQLAKEVLKELPPGQAPSGSPFKVQTQDPPIEAEFKDITDA